VLFLCLVEYRPEISVFTLAWTQVSIIKWRFSVPIQFGRVDAPQKAGLRGSFRPLTRLFAAEVPILVATP